MKYRIEKDSMGDMQVPADVMWGAQTERSLQNFKIGNERMPLELIYAIAYVKKAAAFANHTFGKLSDKQAELIQRAADEIIAGKWNDQFPLSIWQTGSGTQTNMNVNEVIAHIVAGYAQDTVHPNDDVNMSQSTNDVFPTAIHLACVLQIEQYLLPEINKMIQTMKELEAAHEGILKVGRTHLQDATPILFSQEISGWRGMLQAASKMIKDSLVYLKALPIGGTAVGTGLNAPQGFGAAVVEHLNQITKISFTENTNKFHGLSSKDALVFSHGALKTLAANLLKMVNDVRWLASGPRSGLGEITIPANEPGSSIMPGKVNPTQCEALSMIAVQVMGNDTAVGVASSQGNFELNVYMPLLGYQMLQSIQLLSDGMNSFRKNCLVGIKADQKRMEQLLEQSLMLVTALNAHIGYDQAALIAKKAFREQMTLKEAALASALVTEEEFAAWVKPEDMV